MRILATILAAMLLTVSILHAQIIVDGATNTLSSVTNSITGNVTVGTNGPFTLLVLFNNALLTNSADGVIGLNATAKSNEVRLISSTARWRMGGSLYVGNNGAFNRLAVSNGAQLASLSGVLGLSSTSPSNNTVVVNGAGSIWSNVNQLIVGNFSSGNRLEVSGGGWVASGRGIIANRSTSSNNLVLVTGVNSVWSNTDDLTVGFARSGNQLVVSNGGQVWNSYGYIGGDPGGANNLALVTGAGSMWSNQADLYVGASDRGNQLVVTNSGTVVASNLFVGFDAISTSNRVVVDGGTLRVTNGAGTGLLDVRRGTNVLNAGLMEVDQLLSTNSAGAAFQFNGGTLSANTMTINNGQFFRVGNGVSAAMLKLAGNGIHAFANGVIVSANGLLTGNGTIVGAGSASVSSGGTLSPGNPIGRIAFNLNTSSLLQGTVVMEISKNGAALTNDQVQLLTGTLTYGGSLIVSNHGPTALMGHDRFKLFGASSYGGSFSSSNLPSLGAGFSWTNKLLVDGSIEVIGLFVQTLPASGLGSTSATLNGVANPAGQNASVWFEFGLTTNYDSFTPPQALGSGNSDTNFSAALPNLFPNALYHFRAVASNSFGTTFGADQTFPNFAQVAYVKASNAGASDLFGTAIAMSGDTLVIGAVGESSNSTGVNGNQSNNSAPASGAVYIFVRNGDSWVQQAYLKASNTDGDDYFGTSVAVSGDTVVVGAAGLNFNFGGEDSDATGVNGDGNNNNASDSGAAYVFVRTGTNWSQQAYLKASNTGTNDHFGWSVAVSGDTVVVGAPNEDSNATGINGDQNNNSATDAGAAYVFVRGGTSWTQQAYLKASNTEQDDGFGGSVAISDDTIVVGADDEDSNATGVNGDGSNNGAPSSGAAYVFVRAGTTWSQQAYLKASNTQSGDDFGVSVAISGDTVVIGAPFEDSNATGVNGSQSNNSASDSGAAYVLVRNGTNWTQQAYLKASNTGANDLFGVAVAISGDRLVVGAFREDSGAIGVNGDANNNNATDSGAAYTFARNGTTWSFQDYLKANNPGTLDDFGGAVTLAGDSIAVAASFEDSNATGINNGDQNNNTAGASGAAYIFGPPVPAFAEIIVSRSGTDVPDGGNGTQMVTVVPGTSSQSFDIRNTGTGPLTPLTITFDGPDAAMFSVIANPTVPLGPNGTTSFTVGFTPTSVGIKSAALHIANNDADENPFDINLSGVSLSFTVDRDGDGLNDAAEFLLAPLGFRFQFSDTFLVNTLFTNANGAGLFTQSQLQALSVNSPLLAKDPNTGLFKFTIGVEKATQLTNYFPFPMTAPQTTINGEGKLEFQFCVPDNAGFFRLESH